MMMSFITNAGGALIPNLLACAITYLLLMTITERTLENRTLFLAFMFIWMGSTLIGYILPVNNVVYIVFSFAVLGTMLLMAGRKQQSDSDKGEQSPDG